MFSNYENDTLYALVPQVICVCALFSREMRVCSIPANYWSIPANC